MDINELNPTEAPAPMPHSGLGIASFIISIATLVAVVIIFGFAGYSEATNPGGVDETTAMTIGFAIIGSCLLLLIGAVLGIVGLFQEGRRRMFAGIGVGINGVLVLMVIGVIWLGLSYG